MKDEHWANPFEGPTRRKLIKRASTWFAVSAIVVLAIGLIAAYLPPVMP